jgi:hypothetical protein
MAGKKADNSAGKDDEPVVIQTKPGHHKDIGGGESDKWNLRQMRLVVSALPGVNTRDKKNAGEVGSAVISGQMDIKPTDPIEGMLTSQMIVAHEAALDMYRRAWSQPPEYFEARCRYLQMADKAQRTLAILTERLDRHRGAGQQSITVKHVTVNADNAIVGDVNQAPGGEARRPKSRDNPMLLDMQSSPRCGAKTRKGAPCQSPAMPNGRCRMHGGPSPGAPKGNKNALKHGWYTADAIALRRLLSRIRST